MALTLQIPKPAGGSTLTTTTTTTSTTQLSLYSSSPPSALSLFSKTSKRFTCIVSAAGKFTSRTGKFDSKNRRGGGTTTKEDSSEDRTNQLKKQKNFNDNGNDDEEFFEDDGFVMPKLPGDEPNFWEGPQWDALGFFVQYMWAFGIVFALISSGIAVATYNEGATDFKDTAAYKESVETRGLLEGPDASDSDVFEANPTEEAPALE